MTRTSLRSGVREAWLPAIGAIAVLVASLLGTTAFAQEIARDASLETPQTVIVITRHGVRSPTKANELAPYAAHPWPTWPVGPGMLTPHGARLMTAFGAAYRARYAALFADANCPKADAVYVWADVDERTRATASALLAGFAPGCHIDVNTVTGATDALFDAVPSIAPADPQTARAAISGGIGADTRAILPAFEPAFAKLEAILGCAAGSCTRIRDVPFALTSSPKNGLATLAGPIDIMSTAVEDFILEYTEGMRASDVGWGAVDATTIRALTPLHLLKYAVEKTPYVARVEGSNIVAHVLATIDQSATGKANAATRVPKASRFVAFVGHDSTLEEIAGTLRLTWLLPGYQIDDTPPGGALVFEVYRATNAAQPFVRIYFTAQSLEEMHDLSSASPARVAVFVPGCPRLDCPLSIFDAVVRNAIDPAYVATW